MIQGTLAVAHGTLSGECKYSMGIYLLFRQLSRIRQLSLFLFLFIILFRNVLFHIVTQRGPLSGKRTNVSGLLLVHPWAFTTILTMGRLLSIP